MHAAAARLLGTVGAAALLLLASGGAAFAHEERASTFPPGTGTTPTYRPFAQQTPRLVVCKPESRRLIAAIADPRLRAFNQQRLAECRFAHLQAAVDAVTVQGTNIYVLPGTYREEPSHAPPCTRDYDGSTVEYELIVRCGEVINLVTVAGDDPADPDTTCDNALCDLQIEGTGARSEDVVLRGGFDRDGEWVKHNGIKADRADGFYLRNLTAELFRENAVYVHETDGYALDRVNARHNDLYGILAFTTDHGLIRDCEASYNGDSGIYPGSQADVNRDSTTTGPLTRYAVEVTGCESHHNALGLSGTAGNSVYFHGNDVHSNGAGYVADSFVGGHPGMPQDHAYLTGNRIHGNNSNYYAQYVHAGRCGGPPASRGYGTGTVCPAFPVPVGTGILLAGGNYNFVTRNDLYDNWRAGAMLFWVPGAVRGDYLPMQQYDTSNGNHFTANRLGRHPSGAVQPNGVDFSWDEQGIGNCWQDNLSSTGAVTDDAELVALPDCRSGGSVSPVGNAGKTARNAPCAAYNREDMPDPPGCDWFDSPAQPATRQAAPGERTAAPAAGGPGAPPAAAAVGPVRAAAAAAGPAQVAAGPGGLPATGASLLPAAAGLVLGCAVLAVHRRRRAA